MPLRAFRARVKALAPAARAARSPSESERRASSRSPTPLETRRVHGGGGQLRWTLTPEAAFDQLRRRLLATLIAQRGVDRERDPSVRWRASVAISGAVSPLSNAIATNECRRSCSPTGSSPSPFSPTLSPAMWRARNRLRRDCGLPREVTKTSPSGLKGVRLQSSSRRLSDFFETPERAADRKTNRSKSSWPAQRAGLRSAVGGTGLEPVTPSLSSWCSPN